MCSCAEISREQFAAEAAALAAQKEALAEEGRQLTMERDDLIQENDRMLADREEIDVERDALASERYPLFYHVWYISNQEYGYHARVTSGWWSIGRSPMVW